MYFQNGVYYGQKNNGSLKTHLHSQKREATKWELTQAAHKPARREKPTGRINQNQAHKPRQLKQNTTEQKN